MIWSQYTICLNRLDKIFDKLEKWDVSDFGRVFSVLGVGYKTVTRRDGLETI